MYSLGVVLLELFQPFGTEMERTEVLMDLRNGGIPLPFSQEWPTQTKYVKLLTSKVPSRRPTASQVLESELFCNTANVSFGFYYLLTYRVQQRLLSTWSMQRQTSHYCLWEPLSTLWGALAGLEFELRRVLPCLCCYFTALPLAVVLLKRFSIY